MPAPSARAQSTIVPLNGPWTGPALGDAALLIARVARASSARWSRRVPLSVRVGGSAVVSGTAKQVKIIAGGARAPQAYVFEGRNSGKPIAHPVFGRGERIRGALVSTDKHGRQHYEPPGWTWAKQIPPRPFMKEAADAASGKAADTFATRVIGEWARASGFK
jgi:hypothetical protein